MNSLGATHKGILDKAQNSTGTVPILTLLCSTNWKGAKGKNFQEMPKIIPMVT